jgi:hypothetical protein
MALYKELQYYLILPHPRSEFLKVFSDMAEYQKLFQLLSDIDILNTFVLLYNRSGTKPFTSNLLVKELSISLEKAESILKELSEHNFLHKQEIELDDEIKEVNSFKKSYAFALMLMFTKEIINPPNAWNMLSTRATDG